jgi:hypothetical protein
MVQSVKRVWDGSGLQNKDDQIYINWIIWAKNTVTPSAPAPPQTQNSPSFLKDSPISWHSTPPFSCSTTKTNFYLRKTDPYVHRWNNKGGRKVKHRRKTCSWRDRWQPIEKCPSENTPKDAAGYRKGSNAPKLAAIAPILQKLHSTSTPENATIPFLR